MPDNAEPGQYTSEQDAQPSNTDSIPAISPDSPGGNYENIHNFYNAFEGDGEMGWV
jgi:hypothetical protein